MTSRESAAGRPAFTLIEMLVVMTIIVVIATIAIAVAPKFGEKQKTSMGAGSLQGWFFNARQRAYRDGLARGLRFLPNTFGLTAVAGAGTVTVNVPTLDGIHSGSWLLIDGGAANAEKIQVISATSQPSPQFTATFGLAHALNFSIRPWYCSDFQYLEQPDDYSAGTIYSSTTAANVSTVTFTLPTGIDLRNVVTAGQDQLSIRGGSEVHLIANVPTANSVTLATPLFVDIPAPNPVTNPGVDYRIIRAPVPMTGEVVLQLPQDVIVDLSFSLSAGKPFVSLTTPPVDVLFSPSGAVIPQGGASGKYVFWVADSFLDQTGTPPFVGYFQGEPTLIAIYHRTGAIAAHPVNADDQGNPLGGLSYYYFTQDGRSSGL
jgi:prepilin-type N-terminal cleavage/methylation domain-containing protein